MNSSEMGFSSNSLGVRSNFSKTCSVLSQFLKENGSFNDLSLSLSQKSETKEPEIPTTTKNLFPGSGDPFLNETHKSNLSKSKDDPESAPLTIFYMGQVVVFKDFPADKALEIMTMASKSSGRNLNQQPTFGSSNVAESPAESAATINQNIVPTLPIADLPIARKHSLARFLEKRKDRITANVPYQANKAKELGFRPVKKESWLGLTPESYISFQMERH